MSEEQEYKVVLEVFEGPLDLLLYLIKKEEVDVYDIPIETITTQYMQYLDLMRMLDLSIAGEFIVMAATLMMIKSRMLLPVEDRQEMEEDEEDPRWDLVKQLVEYKKFKDAALHLHDLEAYHENIFTRDGEGVHLPADSEVALEDVGIFDLITAFNDVLSRVQKEELREIFQERFTVAEKIDYIMDAVKGQRELIISEIFANMKSRHEIVCTFLALLELIRLKQIRAVQQESFDEIKVIQNDEDSEPSVEDEL